MFSPNPPLLYRMRHAQSDRLERQRASESGYAEVYQSQGLFIDDPPHPQSMSFPWKSRSVVELFLMQFKDTDTCNFT
jgi:hypothetical protein